MRVLRSSMLREIAREATRIAAAIARGTVPDITRR
jgi:hypothetical protein